MREEFPFLTHHSESYFLKYKYCIICISDYVNISHYQENHSELEHLKTQLLKETLEFSGKQRGAHKETQETIFKRVKEKVWKSIVTKSKNGFQICLYTRITLSVKNSDFHIPPWNL